MFAKLNDSLNVAASKYHIIGDAAFPLLTWLMKPFQNEIRMPIIEKNFNYRLSSARMVIENSFGRLKGRWRILLRKPDVHIDTMRKIIYTCFLLHNFCENYNEAVLNKWIKSSEDEEKLLPQESYFEDTNIHFDYEGSEFISGKLRRMEIARYLINDNFSVTF